MNTAAVATIRSFDPCCDLGQPGSSGVVVVMHVRRLSRRSFMTRRKLWMTGIAAAAALTAITFTSTASQAAGAGHPPTGVGSCTLKSWNPDDDPADATALPEGHRPQSYKPDDYKCTGAVFAKPGVEFAKFPQPHNFRITNRPAVRLVRPCKQGACPAHLQTVLPPPPPTNPPTPHFPPFTP